MKARACFLAGAALLLAGAGAWGFAFIGGAPKWPGSTIPMHLELGSGGVLMDGSTSWNAVAQEALGIWNQWIANTQFVGVSDNARSPADGNRVNDIFFDSTLYGDDFGEAVAVTTIWTSGNVRIEGDTIFNATLSWNSYRGSLRRAADGGTLYDLRRVAIHEFGHTLGLDHPDEAGQSVAAIMNSRVSNIDTTQADDERGAQALYGVGSAGTPSDQNNNNGTVSAPAKFTTPLATRVTTVAQRMRFRGTANPSQVKAVYLTNARLNVRRLVPATGLQRWNCVLPLRPGRNAIHLFVETSDGARKRIDTRIVFRESP